MKKKIVSIFICMLLIILVLPNTSGKMENEKYEEITSSELLSDGQPDLIIYDRMNGLIGDDVYSTPPVCQRSDNAWSLRLFPWISCMKLELQKE